MQVPPFVRPLALAVVTAVSLAVAPATARADDACGSSSPWRPVVRVVHHHGASRCVLLPAHDVLVARSVVVPGHTVERVVPERYVVRRSAWGGTYVRVLVAPRHVERVWVPRRVEVRHERVRVPARWVCR